MTIALRLMIMSIAVSSIAPRAWGDLISLGALSYDTFIPGAGGVAGVNAFDIANLTGAFSLPPDFPVADDLTFQSAVLTLTFSDATQDVLSLGDISPGFLLDGSGNPVVQVPANDSFTSAEFTATLSATTFMLFNGTSFTAGSATIKTLLLPSSGGALTVDVDQTTIDASAPVLSTPEPAALWLVASVAALTGFLSRGKSREKRAL